MKLRKWTFPSKSSSSHWSYSHHIKVYFHNINIYSHPKVYRNPLGCRSFCDAPSFFLRSIIIIIIQNHHIHHHHHIHNHHHHHPTLWWPCRSLHSFSRLAFANTGSIGRCSPEKEITMILTSGTSSLDEDCKNVWLNAKNPLCYTSAAPYSEHTGKSDEVTVGWWVEPKSDKWPRQMTLSVLRSNCGFIANPSCLVKRQRRK